MDEHEDLESVLTKKAKEVADPESEVDISVGVDGLEVRFMAHGARHLAQVRQPGLGKPQPSLILRDIDGGDYTERPADTELAAIEKLPQLVRLLWDEEVPLPEAPGFFGWRTVARKYGLSV